jgi:hypothetical protein
MSDTGSTHKMVNLFLRKDEDKPELFLKFFMEMIHDGV